MLTTINPGACVLVVIASLLALEGEFSTTQTGVAAFAMGMIVTIPLIIAVWRTMKKNWPLYRKFYSMSFHRRDMATVRKSWHLTWWILPYTLIIHGTLDLYILFNPALGTPVTFFSGAMFAIFGCTLLQGSKYYEDARREKY